MALTLEEAKAEISKIMSSYREAAAASVDILGERLTAGKLYEAWVLARVTEKLRTEEGYAVTLVGSDRVRLRSAPGPISRQYAYLLLQHPDGRQCEVWTDIEFVGMSHRLRRSSAKAERFECHELDIVIVPPGIVGRPRHDQVHLGVECKNTAFEKVMMRAALGIRRELSLLRDENPTRFIDWPRASVPADPPSVLMVYSTDPSVTRYEPLGRPYGVDLIYEQLG